MNESYQNKFKHKNITTRKWKWKAHTNLIKIEKPIKKYILKHLKEAHFLIFDYWLQSDLNVKSYMDIFAFIPA